MSDFSDLPLVLIDTMTADEVAEYLPQPVVRRVLVARLRAWADLIEAPECSLPPGFGEG